MFNITGDDYRYQVWYNSSATTNSTLSVTDPYDRTMMQIMRGLDEAISARLFIFLAITDVVP